MNDDEPKRMERVRGRRRGGLGAAHCLVLALAASACGGADARRPSVLLIVADTLRADKLGVHGHEGGLSPYLDRLAAEGARFANASAHAPWTLPSTASLLTSLYPRQHGAGGQLPSFRGLDPAVETLAERFRDAGYATASIVNVAFLGETFGLTRGFDHVDAKYFEDNRSVRRAEDTTDAALAWLEAGEEPFFLLVHYFDPHAVYDPPQPFRRRFAAPPDRDDESFVFGTRPHMMALRAGELALEPAVIERAEQLYDGEVAYLDGQIGRLLDGLAELGLDDSTIVAFTADHGEEFLDHGGFEHGHTLYGELTHVPLVLRGPGVSPGRFDDPIGHVDVAPTLCELAGVAPGERFVGRSLLPLLAGGTLEPVPILAHGNFWADPLTSAAAGDYKLILHAGDEAAELYRVSDDPAERRDLAAEQPDIARRMRSLIDEMTSRLAASATGAPIELSEALSDELEALGYGGGASEE